MRFLVIGLLALTACGDDSLSSPTPTPIDSTQDRYDRWIGLVRQDVADSPEINCDPLNWDAAVESLELDRLNQIAVLFALADACVEAGELNIEYSEYHAHAPTP